MEKISILDLSKKTDIKPEQYIILRNDAKKIKNLISRNYKLKGNVLVLDFAGIESITGSVIDEIILCEYEKNPQKKSSKFLGAFVFTNLSDEVFESIENELLARMKKKEKSNEFLLLMENNGSIWRLIPDQDIKPFLEPKLKEALSLVMLKKELTSPYLASLLKEKEIISIKNARIRLEKLFHFRLLNKIQGEGKEFIYRSLF